MLFRATPFAVIGSIRHVKKSGIETGLPDFSSWYNIPKRGIHKYQLTTKIYQLAVPYTKWSYDILNGHKIYKYFKALQNKP
jgi:hypothetical protein